MLEQADTEAPRTDSTLGSSVTTCKKVLCSNSLLETTEYWLRNHKALCRISFLEDKTESSCTTICFLNVDHQCSDQRNDSFHKKLVSVSPDLPKLIGSLSAQQSKENEVLLLSGLESPSSSLDSACYQSPSRDVCLVQFRRRQQSVQSGNIISEVNKYLIGLQSSQELQPHTHRLGHRVEDDTNRSVSSIEEDFMTASEYLGDDSEEDDLRNAKEHGQRRSGQLQLTEQDKSEHLNETVLASKRHIRTGVQKTSHKKQSESTGHYATNLAEAVLQDAFIRLSQDETSFATQAAVSVSVDSYPVYKDLSGIRTCSFDLPKIVIVQSPDNHEEDQEWTHKPHTSVEQGSSSHLLERRSDSHGILPLGHPAHPVELALACAANVIGTISSPQLTEQITQDLDLAGDCGKRAKQSPSGVDYSFSSALCGMGKVASAIAVSEVAEDSSEPKNPEGICSASAGHPYAAHTSTAVTLHYNLAEGTSIESARINIARVLFGEALAVLCQTECQSVRSFVETLHNKILNSITHPKSTDRRNINETAHRVSESIFKHAMNEASEQSFPDISNKSFLQESVNNVLFDVLSVTAKKICEIPSCTNEGEGFFIAQEVNITSKQGEHNQPLGHSATSQHEDCENENNTFPSTDFKSVLTDKDKRTEEAEVTLPLKPKIDKDATENSYRHKLNQSRQNSNNVATLSTDVSAHNGITIIGKHKAKVMKSGESMPSSLTPFLSPQHCLSFTGSSVCTLTDTESRSPITCFADDLATTVVSMATELAAICLENSSGKQPWFCALKGAAGKGSCLNAIWRKESQNCTAGAKKHRPPRLSEIKRKTEEQPELMERLVNRVVDESMVPDETIDPFVKFASEVTTKILNCPELSIIDTSKPGQPRTRLQCAAGERWSRGKAASCESIPEEDGNASILANTLGPGSCHGQNLSRGSSISKQSSCESITDEFSMFMVNQMENEGWGFDLLLDYYAGKNANNILNAAMQQVVTKKNGHLNVRSACLSKQSSTESITEEFYRFMLKDMDKENKDYGLTKTKEWSNSLLPPSPRTPFCFRQSSVPDRRSSDSRLSVSSPIKANSFDGFARNMHGDILNIYPNNTVSATGLCKSDSCLYKRGRTDRITDMLIHETWSTSIESLMRKNKIIGDPEDIIDLDAIGDLQPHVDSFASQLATDIVESGKSAFGNQQDVTKGHEQRPVGERRRGFKHSRPSLNNRWSQESQVCTGGGESSTTPKPREVPLIHIEGDQKYEQSQDASRAEDHTRQLLQETPSQKSQSASMRQLSMESDRAPVSTVCEQEPLVFSASSEESTGSWSHVAPDDDPHEETSSYIQLSEGNGNSSASSLGVADLEAFSEIVPTSTVVSGESEKVNSLNVAQQNADEVTSGLSIGASSSQWELLVVNFDQNPDSVYSELQAVFQWIAASELGIPIIFFKKSHVEKVDKFMEVVQLVAQKAWQVGDLFHAVTQFCKLHEEEDSMPSVFEWLLASK